MSKVLRKYAFLILTLSIFSGCLEEIDYYAEAVKYCSHPVHISSFWHLANPNDSYLLEGNPGCREHLESILPFDDDSFQIEPMTKTKVLEAFYIYLVFPLAFPPEDRILGVSPGSIPIYLTKILTKEGGSINQNWFNHIINLTKEIAYNGDENGPGATFTPFCDLGSSFLKGKLTIYPHFYEKITDSIEELKKVGLEQHWNSVFPFGRAGTLAHEARHGDSAFHHPCDSNYSGWCDSDLNGAMGAGVIFWELLLHGSSKKQYSDGSYYLSNFDLYSIFYKICYNLKERIDFKSNDLQKRLNQIDCSNFDLNQMLEFESLPTR